MVHLEHIIPDLKCVPDFKSNQIKFQYFQERVLCVPVFFSEQWDRS